MTIWQFSLYSHHMENELHSLETKLALLISNSAKLREENLRLRQELAHAQSSNRQFGDRMETAKARLEKLLLTLPEDQS